MDGEEDVREVIIIAEFLARLAEHLDTLSERNARHLATLRELKLLNMVRAAHQIRLLLIPRIQLLEDKEHKILQHAHDLVIMLLELHLQIQTRKLRQMACRIRVLGPEHGSNLHDPAEMRRDEHLLVELRGLGQERGLPEVIELEDVCAALRGRAEDLRRLNEDEATLGEEFLEEGADAALDGEDGVVDFGAQVDGAVVEARVEADEGTAVCFLFFLSLRREWALRVVDLQRQRDFGLVLDKELVDVHLEVLDRGALDGLRGALDGARDGEGALGTDVLRELDHLLAELLAGGHDGLHCVEALAQVQEGELRTLGTSILDPATECDLLVFELRDIAEVDAGRVGRLEFLGTREGQLAVRILGDVLGGLGLLLLALSKLAGLRSRLLLSLELVSYCSALL